MKLFLVLLSFTFMNLQAQASEIWSVTCKNSLLLLPNFEQDGRIFVTEFDFSLGFVGVGEKITSAVLQDIEENFIFDQKDLSFRQLGDLELGNALALGAYMGLNIRHELIRSGQEFTMKDGDGFQARLIILEGLSPQNKLKMFEYNWGQGLCD